MDVDELIDELNKLKMFNPKDYKRKLSILKAKKPLIYNKVIESLGVDDSKIKPYLGKEDPYNIFKPKKVKKGNNLGLVILSVFIIAFLIIGVIFLFITLLPTVGPTSFNASESVMVGYSLFNDLNNSFLQYSYTYNSTEMQENLVYETGRDYYYFDRGNFTAVLFSNSYVCSINNECSLLEADNYLISQKINNTLYYDDCQTLFYNNTEYFESKHVLSVYDELYYFVINDYILSSQREDVWQINGQECAPMYFEINTSQSFYGDKIVDYLLFEICLNNQGVPLAVGKYENYTINGNNGALVLIAYLESTDSQLLGNTDLDGLTLNEWKEQDLSC